MSASGVDQGQIDAYARIGFAGGRFGIGTRPAVLVVDLQRAFVEGPFASPRSLPVLESTASLLERVRALRVPVYYVVSVWEDAADAGLAFRTKVPASVPLLARGRPTTDVHPLVAPRRGDRVLEKKRASAFFHTALDEELRTAGIDTVIVVGTSTSGCVRASAVDAASLDYRVLVIADCVDDRAPASHRASLTDLEAKYADVVSVDEVLAELGERTAQQPNTASS